MSTKVGGKVVQEYPSQQQCFLLRLSIYTFSHPVQNVFGESPLVGRAVYPYPFPFM